MMSLRADAPLVAAEAARNLAVLARRAGWHDQAAAIALTAADLARAHAQHGHRTQCLQALLAAERCAPEETLTRPAVHNLISGLLLSGPTTVELRGLAARCGIT